MVDESGLVDEAESLPRIIAIVIHGSVE